MFNFEKLDVWQKAIDFADFVYSETRKFRQRSGLDSQINYAVLLFRFLPILPKAHPARRKPTLCGLSKSQRALFSRSHHKRLSRNDSNF